MVLLLGSAHNVAYLHVERTDQSRSSLTVKGQEKSLILTGYISNNVIGKSCASGHDLSPRDLLQVRSIEHRQKREAEAEEQRRAKQAEIDAQRREKAATKRLDQDAFERQLQARATIQL